MCTHACRLDGSVGNSVARAWTRAVADLMLEELASSNYDYMTFTFITGRWVLYGLPT